MRSNLRGAMIQVIAFKIIMAERGAGCRGCGIVGIFGVRSFFKIRDVDL